jgi:hypothetical protein
VHRLRGAGHHRCRPRRVPARGPGRAGLRPERVGEGIAEQVGLARRESPHKAARPLGPAKVLEREMPHTLALMRDGRLNEWRATILARETACLSAEHRAIVDFRLCSGGEAATMSDLGLTRAAKKLSCELDVASVAARARRAESEHHVSLRPAPDTMCWVTALLPVTQAVRAYAALLAAFNAARAQGGQRTKGQVMADTLVERVTGAPASETPRVEVKLVMSEGSFFNAADDAAHLVGYGPVPAPWARAFVTDATRAARAWIRRLYVAPRTGELVGLDSRARLAPAALADFIETRDQDLCRTPWCGAPLRDIDHAKSWEVGGRTAESNPQGLCQRCNLAKQAPARPQQRSGARVGTPSRPPPRPAIDIAPAHLTHPAESMSSRPSTVPPTSSSSDAGSRLRRPHRPTRVRQGFARMGACAQLWSTLPGLGPRSATYPTHLPLPAAWSSVSLPLECAEVTGTRGRVTTTSRSRTSPAMSSPARSWRSARAWPGGRSETGSPFRSCAAVVAAPGVWVGTPRSVPSRSSLGSPTGVRSRSTSRCTPRTPTWSRSLNRWASPPRPASDAGSPRRTAPSSDVPGSPRASGSP